MDLIAEVSYASAFSFKYSRRPGTPAATETEQVPEAVKTERLVRLNDLLDAQRAAFNASKLGQTLDVLFERVGRHEGQLIGRTPWLQSVWAEADQSLLGEVHPVAIIDQGPNSLVGRLL